MRVAIWVQIADAQRGFVRFSFICTETGLHLIPASRSNDAFQCILPVRSSRSSSLLRPRLLVSALWRVRVDHANSLGLIWFLLSYRAYICSRMIRYPDNCQDYVQHILKTYWCADIFYRVSLFKINLAIIIAFIIIFYRITIKIIKIVSSQYFELCFHCILYKAIQSTPISYVKRIAIFCLRDFSSINKMCTPIAIQYIVYALWSVDI